MDFDVQLRPEIQPTAYDFDTEVAIRDVANQNNNNLTIVIVYFPFLTRWSQQEGGKSNRAPGFFEKLVSFREFLDFEVQVLPIR